MRLAAASQRQPHFPQLTVYGDPRETVYSQFRPNCVREGPWKGPFLEIYRGRPPEHINAGIQPCRTPWRRASARLLGRQLANGALLSGLVIGGAGASRPLSGGREPERSDNGMADHVF